MEKKTIGGLIAALRRANGMTQRELAERLNVSDKTVSRWECDESAPDISLIPVIAEIFHITCDELLCGERRTSTEDSRSDMQTSTRGEKQRKRLLSASLTRYRNLSLITLGIALCGLLAALVINFGFLRAYIGFYVGSIFFVAGVICQVIGINRAFLAVSDEENGNEEIGLFKYSVILTAERTFALIATLLGATLPLILYPGNAYVGLRGETFLPYGALFGIVLLLIYVTVCFFAHHSMLKRGVFVLTEQMNRRYHYNRTLKIKCVSITLPLLVVTLIIHIASTEIWGPRSIMKGKTFYDYESFTAYMEQDIPYYHLNGSTAVAMPTDCIYYDQYGNEISEEEAMRRTLTLCDGTVVCDYVARNQSVCSVRYTEQDGSLLPITVCTYDNLQAAQAQVQIRHALFAIAYIMEIVAALGIYFVKRAKES
jgi:transcriptional regulator with XRE-family HTH domain